MASGQFKFVVVFDPAGEKMVGSGELATAGGDIEFGFEAKPEDGGIEGEFEVEIEPAGGGEETEFESTSFDTLLFFGNWAFSSGVGVMEDGTGVGFWLAGAESDPDAVRIRIWRLDNPSVVVLDTQPGAFALSYPTTALGDGEIKIKTGEHDSD